MSASKRRAQGEPGGQGLGGAAHNCAEDVLILGDLLLRLVVEATDGPGMLDQAKPVRLMRCPTRNQKLPPTAQENNGEVLEGVEELVLVMGQQGQAERQVHVSSCCNVTENVMELVDSGLITVELTLGQVEAAGPGHTSVSLTATISQPLDPRHPRICGSRRKHLPKITWLYLQLGQPAGEKPAHGRARQSLRLVDVFEDVTATPTDVRGAEKDRRDRLNTIIGANGYFGTPLFSRPLPVPGTPSEEKEKEGPPSLMAVSDEVLGQIFGFLEAQTLRALGHTSRFFLEATASIVPGLRARPFPHQRRCLEWMLAREEGATRTIMHPAYRRYECKDGREIYVDLVEGIVALHKSQVPVVPDFRGGMLCDEPGLGKTVTALALILARRGLLPASPPNYMEEEGEEEMHGNPYGGTPLQPSKRRFAFRSPGSRRREVDPLTLLPSAATLLIVPGPLVPHWREQIDRHADTWALGRVYYEHDAEGGKGGARLPDAEELARYDVVVLSRERLSNEWTHGKPPCALDARRPARYSDSGWCDDPSGDRVSELLRVHWLRVIVDEGHSLGSLNITNAGRMASCLAAERRWVLTGTPSRHDHNDLRSLRSLLSFLREPLFGAANDELFSTLITRCPAAWLSRERLGLLLRRVMIRHTKACIPEIPPPIVHHRRLRMSPLEARTYNNFVSIVQANLVTTGLIGGGHRAGEQHPDSLLNPRNYRFAGTCMENVRLACCGGGLQEMEISSANVATTLNLTTAYGGDAEALAKVSQFTSNVRNGRMSTCDHCGVRLELLLLLPRCFHLLCCACMLPPHTPACAACGTAFYVDDFQRLQPGISMRWKEFELQVVEGVKVLRAADGGPLDEADDHDDGTWDVISKAKHMMEVLRDYQIQLSSLKPTDTSIPHRPLKALVFSQFKSYLNSLSAALKSQGFRVAEFFGPKRAANLECFTRDPGVQVLLTGKEGSHGLDLSFVTHIFLMEEIWDAGLEDQVISRAYRMGASHPVIVEKLAMAGSVEETMHDILHDAGHKRHGQLAENAEIAGTAGDGPGEDGEEADDVSVSGREDPSLSGRDDASLSSAAGPPSPAPSSPPPSDPSSSSSSSKKRKPLNPWTAHAKRRRRSSSSQTVPQSVQQRRELSRMHTLLQSLTLVTPDLIRSKPPRPAPCDDATMAAAMAVDGSIEGHVEGHVGHNGAVPLAVNGEGAPEAEGDAAPKERRTVRFAMDGDAEGKGGM